MKKTLLTITISLFAIYANAQGGAVAAMAAMNAVNSMRVSSMASANTSMALSRRKYTGHAHVVPETKSAQPFKRIPCNEIKMVKTGIVYDKRNKCYFLYQQKYLLGKCYWGQYGFSPLEIAAPIKYKTECEAKNAWYYSVMHGHQPSDLN